MKISICVIGKTKPQDPENILIQEYIKRSKWNIETKEFATKKIQKEDNVQKHQESELLLENTKNSHLIALDSKGSILSSEEFAKFLSDLQIKSGHISFCIGGSHGHHKSLLDKSQNIISLGKMTLPHKLAKLILVEQLYRAECILNNHPYHK